MERATTTMIKMCVGYMTSIRAAHTTVTENAWERGFLVITRIFQQKFCCNMKRAFDNLYVLERSLDNDLITKCLTGGSLGMGITTRVEGRATPVGPTTKGLISSET